MEINEASFDLQGRVWIRDPDDSDFLGIRGRFVKDVTERFAAAGFRSRIHTAPSRGRSTRRHAARRE